MELLLYFFLQIFHLFVRIVMLLFLIFQLLPQVATHSNFQHFFVQLQVEFTLCFEFGHKSAWTQCWFWQIFRTVLFGFEQQPDLFARRCSHESNSKFSLCDTLYFLKLVKFIRTFFPRNCCLFFDDLCNFNLGRFLHNWRRKGLDTFSLFKCSRRSFDLLSTLDNWFRCSCLSRSASHQ